MSDLPPPPAAPPAPGRKKPWPVIFTLIALVVVGGAVGGYLALRKSPVKTHTLIGEMTLSGSDNVDYPADGNTKGTCWGKDGYDDLAEGGSVVVTSDGKTVALGELSAGKLDTAPDDPSLVVGCIFTFTIRDVPDRAFYEVEVTHRGKLTYSKAKLEDSHWLVFTSIGS